jgi:DNA mismatch repair ATPase MutS
MSKFYNLYLDYKNKDNNYLYLFKCGNFYIFIGEDCDYICKVTTLKKVKFTNEVYKCGFPLSSLNTYLNIFKEIGLKVKVIEDTFDNNVIINKLNDIDINSITGIEALNILKELKELV